MILLKQIFLRKGELSVEDVPKPFCRDEGIVVKNAYSVISSGTERHSIETRKDNIFALAMKHPEYVQKVVEKFKAEGFGKTRELVETKLSELVPLGYSSAGVVVEVGKNSSNFSVGDIVACGGQGYAGHADYVYVPKNIAVKVPGNVDLDEAAFATIGAIALQGVRRSQVVVGENVAVIGLGLIGMLTVQILKASGCRVIGSDVDPKRIALAKKLGLDVGVVAGRGMKNYESFSPAGVDSVIITAATRTNDPIKEAIRICRKRGRIVLVGNVPMEIPREEFYKKELDFLISTSYGPGRYDKEYEERGKDYPLPFVRWTEQRNMEAFLNLVSSGQIKLKPLIKQVFDIENAKEAYESLDGPATSVFRYNPDSKTESVLEVTPKKVEKEKIKVALIGAGNFAKGHHLPNLARIKDFDIYSIVDPNPAEAKIVAEQYNAKYCSTDYMEAINDKNVDAVVISTRDSLHAEIALAAAKAGKHIFSEKPMSITEQETETLIRAIRKAKVNYTVGFNRRYAPLVLKAKDLLSERNGPYMINYTVAAGSLPDDHWVYDANQSGGRIVSECCHFFDLFGFFAEADVQSVTANSISSSPGKHKNNDNITAIVKFKDGSVCTLNYNSIGGKGHPKERIEIFRDGASAVIDNFSSMKLFGLKESSVRTKGRDKGHFSELEEFAKLVKGQGSQSASLNDCIRATKISFEVVRDIGKHDDMQES